MLKIIQSRENALFKQLKQLATSSQARKREGLALAEGIHLAQSCLPHALPRYCVLSASAVDHPEVAPLLQACLAKKVECLQLDDKLFAQLSQLENGIGILFVLAPPQATLPARLEQDAVLLDQIQDPGNMGSILRSAAAAGIKQVFCSPGCVQCWSPKVLRAGMGAHFVLEIFENVALQELITHSAIDVLATSSHAEQVVYDMDLRSPHAWIFGNEGQGVSPELLQMAARQVALPHLGVMESLNVAACAAICFFEQVRQKCRQNQA